MSGPKMLVDQDWLRRHTEADLDTDCEATSVAGVYPGWRGVTQPCDVCGKPVAVNAVSPSENHCSEACASQAYGLDDEPSSTKEKG